MDVVSCNQGNKGQFKLYKNKGNGTFELFKSISGASVSETFYYCNMADIDNDGDMDLFGTSQSKGIYYLKNEGGGTFSNSPTYMSSKSKFALTAQIADINYDKNIDVITVEDNGTDYSIIYYLNKGNGTFDDGVVFHNMPKYSSISGARGLLIENWLQLVDFDGDGSKDLLVNDTRGQTVLLFTNLLVSSVKENAIVESINVYPNPVANMLHIDNEEPIASIQILNMDGREILSIDNVTKTVDVSRLVPGQYILKANAVNQKIFRSTFIKI